MTFEIRPSGPFNLMSTNQYFGGWFSLNDDLATMVMVSPVEGWRTSAAVLLRQAQGSVVEVFERAEVWRPYRMWASVLLHVWFRRETGGPQCRGNIQTARKRRTNGARSSIA